MYNYTDKLQILSLKPMFFRCSELTSSAYSLRQPWLWAVSADRHACRS